MGAPDYDLLPVQAVHQVLMLLRDVLESRDAVMSGRSNAKEEFNKVLLFLILNWDFADIFMCFGSIV